ncbi:hypothetical protein D9M71_152920 [compost metagenome]
MVVGVRADRVGVAFDGSGGLRVFTHEVGYGLDVGLAFLLDHGLVEVELDVQLHAYRRGGFGHRLRLRRWGSGYRKRTATLIHLGAPWCVGALVLLVHHAIAVGIAMHPAVGRAGEGADTQATGGPTRAFDGAQSRAHHTADCRAGRPVALHQASTTRQQAASQNQGDSCSYYSHIWCSWIDLVYYSL